MNPFEHAEAQFDTYLAQLKALLAIPSVSTLPEHKPDVQRAAEWLADHFREIGMARAEVFPTEGHPFVYAEWLGAEGAPTVLIYGHYDVQPPDPLDEWEAPPFEPVVRGGNLYARGASDDKGQLFANIKAADALLAAEGRLPVNVKFILEGEEESGSRSAPAFVHTHRQMLAADAVLISDTGILAPDLPCIYYGLRGMVALEVEVSGPKADLHSGGYGGTVHNPAQALAEILAALHDAEGRVDVPGFYDDVRPLSEKERAEAAKLPWGEAEWRAETGAPAPWGEPGYTLVERIGARPTLEVNGIVGGFIGKGMKTIIPARAAAKISCRLVPDQNPDTVFQQLQARIHALAPDTVHVNLTRYGGSPAFLVDTESPAVEAAAAAYKAGFGAEPVFIRNGGSIPIASLFQKELGGVPVVLMGYGLMDDNIHSPNEKIALASLKNGIQTGIHFLQALA